MQGDAPRRADASPYSPLANITACSPNRQALGRAPPIFWRMKASVDGTRDILIVGGEDPEVILINRQAQGLLAGESRLEIVPGAGHLFEEPGALERVAELTRDWFEQHLVALPPSLA